MQWDGLPSIWGWERTDLRGLHSLISTTDHTKYYTVLLAEQLEFAIVEQLYMPLFLLEHFA